MINIVKEINLGGIFVSPMMGYLFFTACIWLVLKFVLKKIGFYALVWHPPLFNLSLFVIILSAAVVTTL